jgi:hypothetical protein
VDPEQAAPGAKLGIVQASGGRGASCGGGHP